MLREKPSSIFWSSTYPSFTDINCCRASCCLYLSEARELLKKSVLSKLMLNSWLKGRCCHLASLSVPASCLHFLWYAVLLWWCFSTPTLSHSLTTSLSPSISVQEEQNRGKPNWEHLNEDLHVLITVEDSQARAEIKMRRAVEEVKKLLVPAVSTWHARILVQTTGQLGYIWQTASIPLSASCLLPHIERENRLAVHPVEWKNIARCTHLLWPHI